MTTFGSFAPRQFSALLMTASILTCLSVAGCKFQRVETAARAKEELVGMNKGEILACMGAPAGRMSEGSTEVWTYLSGGDSVYHGSGTSYTTGSSYSTGYSSTGSASTYGSASGVVQNRSCKIDLVISSDVVRRVLYSGRTGGLLTKGEQCAFAVENCVQ